jgi:hypothetical protein
MASRKPNNTQAAESQRLERALADAEKARRERDAALAQLGCTTNPLITRIVDALVEAGHLAHPATGNPIDTEGPRPQPGSRTPAGAFTPARRAAKHLVSQLEAAVNGWDAARRRIDQPDDPINHQHRGQDRVPQSVRCRVLDCATAGKRVPWLELHPDSEGVTRAVIVWDCRGCGNPYPNHPAGNRQPARVSA